MAKHDARKQSLYFPDGMIEDIKGEAIRLDRPISWIIQKAWEIAQREIKRIPSVGDVLNQSK
jgi:uncharacterized small protein (TIGR04563 family)